MQSNKFCRWQNFPQYKFAYPSVYGNSFYLFRNRYFDMVGYATMLSAFHALLYPHRVIEEMF